MRFVSRTCVILHSELFRLATLVAVRHVGKQGKVCQRVGLFYALMNRIISSNWLTLSQHVEIQCWPLTCSGLIGCLQLLQTTMTAFVASLSIVCSDPLL